MGKLADAYVELTTRDGKMMAGLAGARARLGAFASSAKSTLTIPFTIAGGVGAAAATAFLYDATQKAADLSETMNKVSVTFGDSADEVKTFAKDLSDQFGIVRNVSLDAAANFGLITQGMGLSTEESAKLSTRLVKLAADAGSFFNVPVADALEKIRAGLVGEAEPLRTFGVNLSETAVQARAVEMGLAKTAKEVGDTAKVMARADLITKGLAKASGDLDRTQDGLVNRQRILIGRFEEFRTELGNSLIPVMEDLVSVAEQLNEVMKETFNAGAVESFANALRGVITTAGMIGKSPAKTIGAAAGAAALDQNNIVGQIVKAMLGPAGSLIPTFDKLTGASDRLKESLVQSAMEVMGPGKGGGGGAVQGKGKLQNVPPEHVLNEMLVKAGVAAVGNVAAIGGAGVAKGSPSSWTDQLSGARQLQLDALATNDPAKEMVKEQKATNVLLREIARGPRNRDDKTPRVIAVARGRE